MNCALDVTYFPDRKQMATEELGALRVQCIIDPQHGQERSIVDRIERLRSHYRQIDSSTDNCTIIGSRP